MVGLITALLVKHVVFDWFYQPAWMWQKKGTFGAWGGIAHSGIHAVVTAIILAIFLGLEFWPLVLGLAVFEFVIHYWTDWSKMNINRIRGWKCNTHEEFWYLTGVDLLIHLMTYMVIAWVVERSF